MPLESGIIVPVPDAESVVGPLRSIHDPQARYGVPAHITLLYPFVDPPNVGSALDALHRVFGDVPVFDFSFAEVRRFPGSAYLHPEPSAPFIRLTELLVQKWPQFPPYRGLFSTVIPHLTVADRAATDVLDIVETEMAGRLPIRCRATEAWLMCSDERDMWARREVFEFRKK